MSSIHQPRTPRQLRLLALVHALGDQISSLDFQKLLFLYCQEPANSLPYEFVPYKFGAFSFTSYADRRKLIERGLLADEESTWLLTAKSRQVLSSQRDTNITRFADHYRNLRGDLLVAETYRQFPYYAINSEIAERVLGDDEAALQRIEFARPKANPSTLLTIGYEGRSLENYLNLLLGAGATVLCDVRRNAISRKYGFSKSTLENACSGVGIRYVHRPKLGISTEKRRNLRNAADYLKLFREYEQRDLPQQEDAVAEANGWVRSGECVALTCYERNVENCHRGIVAMAIERQTGLQSSVYHL